MSKRKQFTNGELEATGYEEKHEFALGLSEMADMTPTQVLYNFGLEFRPVVIPGKPEFDNLYIISNFGLCLRAAPGPSTWPGSQLTPANPGVGLPMPWQVGLHSGRNKKVYLADLVYRAFVGDIPEGYTVAPIDGNPYNVWAGNLTLVESSLRVPHNRLTNQEREAQKAAEAEAAAEAQRLADEAAQQAKAAQEAAAEDAIRSICDQYGPAAVEALKRLGIISQPEPTHRNSFVKRREEANRQFRPPSPEA